MPRRGGSAQTFCSADHRRDFHAAARRFAEQAVSDGVVTVADLQNSDAAAFTLRTKGEAAAESPGIANASEASEKAAALARKLDELIGAFHDELTEDEWEAMPHPMIDLVMFAFDLRRQLDLSENRCAHAPQHTLGRTLA